MNTIAHKLCSIQGRLFELSAKQGYDSFEFAKVYMNSDIAAKFNSAYDRSQWMGEEYLLEELSQTYPLVEGKVYSVDVMFWMGYTYAYWCIVYGDTCKNIIKMADPKVMAENYAGLHTVSADIAIQNLKGQYWSSHGKDGTKFVDEAVKRIIKDNLNAREGTDEYQRMMNDAGVDILFLLKNEACRNEYKNQLRQYREYIEGRMYVTYIDYIMDLIDKADISPNRKAEYSYIVQNMMGGVVNRGFSKKQFIFLDWLESSLRPLK